MTSGARPGHVVYGIAMLLTVAVLAAACGSGDQTEAVSAVGAPEGTTSTVAPPERTATPASDAEGSRPLDADGCPSDAECAPVGSTAPTTTGPETPPTTSAADPVSREPVDDRLRVALVGDSLLRMAEPYVREALADHDVTVDGRNGHLINDQLPQAETMAATDPDVLVVVLGANDAGPNFTREAMGQDVVGLLDAVSHVRCVRWVTVQEDFYLPDVSGAHGTLTLNVTLYREAARRSNLEVVDFAPIINDQPDWHVMDVLHLDERGSRAMAELIRDSLDCPTASFARP